MRNKKLVILIWALSIFFGLMKCAYAEPMSTAAALMWAAGIGAGGGILGGLLGGRGGDQERETFMPKVEFLTPPAAEWRGAPSPEQYAEFPEAEAARKQWFGKLEQWGGEPGYGAIAPDWGDIWEQAQSRVKQYYWGGPGGQPGIAGKVKASAARRGVSESPAMERELGLMGMQEAGDIRQLAGEQAVQKAQFGEAGRQTWLQSLMGMTGVRPQYYQPGGMWQSPYAQVEQSYMTPGTTGPTTGELVGELGSAAGGVGMQYAQQKWLEDLLKGMNERTKVGNIPKQSEGSYNFAGGGYDPYDYLNQ